MSQLPPEWLRVNIRGVTFNPDGSAVVEYVTPAKDARANGVTINHAMFVPHGADYDDELDALMDAATYLINDVLEDFPTLEPIRPPDEEDDDDDD